MSVSEQIRWVIAETAGVSAKQVEADSVYLYDICDDSLGVYEVTMALEDRFGVVFGEEGYLVETIGQTVAYVQRLLEAQGKG